MTDEGQYPEGSLEDIFDERKASDVILTALIEEEKSREKELKKAVRNLDIWKKIFEPIEGVGEIIAARLVAAVIDIRRFGNKNKFVAFCGVHVNEGKFVRRTRGITNNYHPEARQALYILADQFIRRKKSVWGKKFLENKAEFRRKCPQKLCKKCGVPWEECSSPKSHTSIYSDAHIHKMTIWRTITQFTKWLYREWSDLYTE